MNAKEKEVARRLAEAFNSLPDAKKEFLIGYAEGVVAMVEKQSDASGVTTAGCAEQNVPDLRDHPE